LYLRVHSYGTDARDGISLVQAIAAGDAAVQFGDDTVNPWMRKHEPEDLAPDLGGWEIRRESVAGVDARERVEKDLAAVINVGGRGPTHNYV